ncbi:hypothetical protein E2C01_004464 [Portunus trituberculatus]|uniref:Uncharacterized protein n=1 Tax=Portunus trituberculatus TaxID=210409 RepID=A0A5B7CQL1_PORTR|nr:hypothetical protein [Portunus trituberculatus]
MDDPSLTKQNKGTYRARVLRADKRTVTRYPLPQDAGVREHTRAHVMKAYRNTITCMMRLQEDNDRASGRRARLGSVGIT